MLTLLLGLAPANPLDAWGPHVGVGTLALNPNVYRDADGGTELQAIVGCGMTRRFDVQVAAATGLPEGAPAVPGPLELLPRWFVADGVGLVLKGVWLPGTTRLGPEVHLTQPVGMSFEAYVDGGGAWGWRDGQGAPDQAFLVAGLEWVAPPKLRPYLESHTEAVAGEATALFLTPGVYLLLDDAGAHELSAGVRTPMVGGRPAVAGVWYNRNLALR